MNIREAKTEIKNALLAYHRKDPEGNYRYPALRQRPILLMGPPGIGKTAIMEQVARECGVGLVAYTITHHTRQSAVGLPRIVTRSYGGEEITITEYTMSEIVASVYDCMERTGKKEGILFIDEINCVSETLAPTMLQFLQNKTFGTHRVPEGWMIVAAGNPAEYNKSVREFDIVTLDRVRKINVEPDCGVWLEYAREQGVHGAVLSYLTMKEDRFYQVSTRGENRQFVTARGWEDLLELLWGYEELQLEITGDQTVQFLQEEDTARDFAAYYQLYKKYGEDYQIPEILSGQIGENARKQKAALAGGASFEERFTLIRLLLDTLDQSFRECKEEEQFLTALREALTGSELEERIRDRKDSLEVKLRMELLNGREAALEKRVICRLEEYDLDLRKQHLRDSQARFDRIRALFQEEIDRREKQVKEIGKQLERAFAFAQECFGDGQEMILLVSGLAGNRRCRDFISEHGCVPFLQYSSLLTDIKPREELLKACRELREERRGADAPGKNR